MSYWYQEGVAVGGKSENVIVWAAGVTKMVWLTGVGLRKTIQPILGAINHSKSSFLKAQKVNNLTLILLPGAFSVFVNLFYFFKVEIINQKFWENLTFIISI